MNNTHIRYILVGIYNAAIGYGVFLTLNLTLGEHIHYLSILAISYFLSTTNAYIGQRLIVFRSNSPWINQYIRFLLVNISTMGINAVLLFLLVEAGLGVPESQGISILITTILSYFGHRHFSFQ